MAITVRCETDNATAAEVVTAKLLGSACRALMASMLHINYTKLLFWSQMVMTTPNRSNEWV